MAANVAAASLLAPGESVLSALPRICGLAPGPVRMPSIPTALDMEVMMSCMRVNALNEARSHFAVSTDASGHVTYLGHASDGSSDAAVVAVDRIGTGAHAERLGGFVSKGALLEVLPRLAARAQTSLIEMYTSIVVSGSVDMVYLDAVRTAEGVLLDRPRVQAAFDHAAVVAPLIRDGTSTVAVAVAVADPNPAVSPEDSVGAAFFRGDHLLAAMRLLAHINAVDTAPAWYAHPDETADVAYARWTDDVHRAFRRFVDEAAFEGITLDNVGQYPAARVPRRYGHQRNAEHINEVVAGARVTHMRNSRTAVAFTPIVDYFAFPVRLTGTSERAGAALHVVTPRYAVKFVDALREKTREAPTLDAIFLVRSVLAQVLLSLEAAQTHLRFTHYDLHINNVMLTKATAQEPERANAPEALWRYVRPNAGNGHARDAFVVPAVDSRGFAARIIDFGRARCDDPRHPGNDARASFVDLGECPPCARFDAHVDMRALAHDIVMHGLYRWAPHFARAACGARVSDSTLVEEYFLQLVSVLEDMSGVRWWAGWNGLAQAAPHFRTDGVRAACPRSLCGFIALGAHRTCGRETLVQIRTAEFMMVRPEEEHAATPSNVLDAAFFLPYRMTQGTTHSAVVVEVADASRPPLVGEEGNGPPGSVPKKRRFSARE